MILGALIFESGPKTIVNKKIAIVFSAKNHMLIVFLREEICSRLAMLVNITCVDQQFLARKQSSCFVFVELDFHSGPSELATRNHGTQGLG